MTMVLNDFFDMNSDGKEFSTSILIDRKKGEEISFTND